MSTVIDVPAALGEYMLKGWVMLNQSCPNAGCPVPLLRSPSAVTPIKKFCVKCNGSPNNVQAVVSHVSTSSTSTASHISRSSTPPTDVSDSFELPDFIPVETEYGRQRREQSDRASAEIAQRLLRNWTLLGEDCPNSRCYGIPLLRQPRSADGEPLKECVICGNKYSTLVDDLGGSHLSPIPTATPVVVNNVPPSRGPGDAVMQSTHIPAPSPSPEAASPSNIFNDPVPSQSLAPIGLTISSGSFSSEIQESELSLKLAMRTLSTRLTSLSNSPLIIDPAAIAQTAESLGRVSKALGQLRELQRQDASSH